MSPEDLPHLEHVHGDRTGDDGRPEHPDGAKGLRRSGQSGADEKSLLEVRHGGPRVQLIISPTTVIRVTTPTNKVRI